MTTFDQNITMITQSEEKLKFRWYHLLLAEVLLVCSLLLFGAIPFVMIPAYLQADWVIGFAESMAQNNSLYAHNIGCPHPAAPAFGLSGVLPTAFFIKLGLRGPDAYSLVFMCYIILAFLGAYRLAWKLGAGITLSLLLALLWLSAPIVWWHVGYSMVSLGMALLPSYLLMIYELWNRTTASVATIGCTFLSCLISIFMDGYTFVMFFCGSAIIALWFLWKMGRRTVNTTVFTLTIHIVSFVFAYILYSLYIGQTSWPAHPLDFFRGWGVDISFLIIPTKEIHGLLDWLGFSQTRSELNNFGDGSVFCATFMLFNLIVAIWGMIAVKDRRKWFICAIALLGIYMSLGPTVKLFSVRPPGVSQLMPEHYGIFPTGSAYISQYLPGFNTMRASYRWMTLGWVGLWGVITLLTVQYYNRGLKVVALGMVVILTLINVPEPVKHLKSKRKYRTVFSFIQSDIIIPLKKTVQVNDKVLFLPLENGFSTSYVASQLGEIRAYNISGDKNISIARKYWPPIVSSLLQKSDPSWLSQNILTLYALFMNKDIDILILTYFRGTHPLIHLPGLEPDSIMVKNVELILEDFEENAHFDITREKWWATVRLRKGVNPSDLARTVSNPLLGHILDAGIIQTSPANLPSNVGKKIGNSIASDGRQGALIYGPYQSLEAGEYQLIVTGEVKALNGAYIDIVGSKGREVYHRELLQDQKRDGSSIAEMNIAIPKNVEDIEIRVWVYPGDNLQIDGYILRSSKD